MRWLCGAAVLLALVVAALAVRRGGDLEAGVVSRARRPAERVADETAMQHATAARLGVGIGGGPDGPRDQILFGDLHVHTTWSIDAFLYALPIFSSEGAHPPADACDYARHCAGLDFFSINDHAESLTPERWRRTIDTLRACDARAGAPDDPDLIPLLGWEWTQVGATPETHYGHKNVVVRRLEEGGVPARPIAYRPASDMQRAPEPWQLRAGESVARLLGRPYADFMWWMGRLLAVPACAADVPSPDLPGDCLESADTPADLFRKLDEWSLDTLVVPHGLAWGIHAPPGARLDRPLAAGMHDPAREVLLEVYSGHGNSEEYRPALTRRPASDPTAVCPAPTGDFLACCWQAGEIMRARCGDLPADECERRVEEARRLALEAGIAPQRVFPDASPEAWLDCDECRDCFKPAARLRAGQTAQYGLAVSRPDADGDGAPERYRWGFIASSDNHSARAATGFKQVNRLGTTDARGLRDPATAERIARIFAPEPGDPRRPRPVAYEPRSFAALFEGERNASFMYTGGLVAVHARGRSRDALWEALMRREVYGTSGPRILLWFDLLNGPEGPAPMGSHVRLGTTPRFRVRAAGARVQQPGCPASVREALGDERTATLCLDECHHPGDTRHPVVAIEVVRVRPQTAAGEPVGERIEDPWRVFDCPPDPAGCSVEFDDPDFVARRDDAVYYVRALQAPTPAINADGLRPTFDEDGRAVSVDPCYGSFRTPEDDDCLAPARERAWSSPIYVDRAPDGSS
jgi:hypothetical protein